MAKKPRATRQTVQQEQANVNAARMPAPRLAVDDEGGVKAGRPVPGVKPARPVDINETGATLSVARSRRVTALGPSVDADAHLQQGRIKVRVQEGRTGYYDDSRRREGDVFLIRDEADFSDKWMEYVDASTPERLTTAKGALAKETAMIRGVKFADAAADKGDEDVLGS